MGLEQASMEVQQRIRSGKITLARMTLNKRAEALNLGVHPRTMGRWLDVADPNNNMPWQLLSLHSASDHLLGMLAEEKDMVLVREMGLKLNGCVDDERDRILAALGKAAERLMAYRTKRQRRPLGKWEAEKMLPIVEEIVSAGVTMRAELHAMVQGEG